ncbi:MAG: hypothetical protein IPO08_22470 [Xanthomonadales bacterium]|nr:hypothetical protein [Xanthomonadales bacterium]
MSNATYQQVGRWRNMPRTTETVVTFAAQWVDECGVWPGYRDVATIFKMNNDAACSLLREARAVMEAMK